MKIKSAKSMRKKTIQNEIYQRGFEQAVESVMRRIEKASEQGLRSCVFSPSAYWYTTESGGGAFMNFDDEVREAFRKKGYTFKPTGYIDGVWQNTKDICW